MKRQSTFQHEFVEFLPTNIAEGIVYVSMAYATAAHRCACGCGNEVVTPLSPTDWQLSFDGVSISLTPSIGNWNFPCRSHYFITHNKVQWAHQWSEQRIEAGRKHDRRVKEQYFGEATPAPDVPVKKGRLRRLRDRFLGR
jgi:Family of unknown function (DUF6527)